MKGMEIIKGVSFEVQGNPTMKKKGRLIKNAL